MRQSELGLVTATYPTGSRRWQISEIAARLALAALPVTVALVCTSEPAEAGPPAHQQQIIDRLDTIWPAIEHYSFIPESGGHRQFMAVVDPTMYSKSGDPKAAAQLSQAVALMGRHGQVDPQGATHLSDGWRIATADVTWTTSPYAGAEVCYTYTDSWYSHTQDTQHAPGASEASVELIDVDNTWYLHSIDNDHVVPDCSPKA